MFEDIFGPKEKKVEYLELIYDLIFVYLIGRNSSFVQHAENGFINWGLFLTYILFTLIIIQIWCHTAFYINRYGSNGVRDHICIFINMYLLYFMADATRTEWQAYYYRYNIAWALILLNLGLQYYLKLRKAKQETPWEAAQQRRTMWILFIQAAIVLVSLPVFSITGLPLSPLAMVFGIVATVASAGVNNLVSVDFPHLSERAMLYVVFTFGEMIIALAPYFSGAFTVNTIYFSLMAFLIVVGLFLSYELFYDHLLDKNLPTNGIGYMMMHVFLIFSLSSITVALEFMQEEAIDAWPKVIYITASLLVFYLFLFLLGKYSKCDAKPTGKFIIMMCLASAVFAALMMLFHENMYVNIALTALYVFFIFFIFTKFRKRHGC